MRQNSQMHTIFHLLLSYGGFLVTWRALGAVFTVAAVPFAGWVTDLAGFLTAVMVFFALYRKLGSGSVPEKTAEPCSAPMAFVHVGYGFFWLIVAMALVLLVFPVSGDPVQEALVPRLIAAVLVHPLLEEILFRRICQDHLLTLSEDRTEPGEVVDEDTPVPQKTPERTRAGMLFAVLTQALLFALVHTGGGGMLYGFGGGVVLGVLMLRTGRLWVPVVCHMLINLRSVGYPYLPDAAANGLDVLWLAAGLACGCVFWVQRYRTEREKRTTV